ncbi:amino acid deaminase/aldolase [Virgibacillus doumboii]|uniref:amino acid deaminase/aldolase n=1 Tax=Virgibacillus doumboii TaxID=2697503 RepID=UPI0013E0A342|nr:amino acid deaminase/aldolase [Virgibacillus doumboii]
MQNYVYYKEALMQIPKPCAFLDTAIFEQNIRQIAAGSNGKKIRVASKSIRSVSVLKDIFKASPIFQGIMCFTADEAIYLSSQGLDDLLVAYPVWNEFHLNEVLKRVNENKQITLMIDSIAHLKRLESIAQNAGGSFPVCIDIDLSSDFFGLHFGVYRSPITTVEQTLNLADYITDSDFLHLDGIMGYEAQIAGVPDNNPDQKLKSRLIRYLKKRSSKELIQKRNDIIDQLKARGIPLRFVNGGGTGSLHQTSQEQHITEVTVGSGFFNPHQFDNYKDFQLQPAAGFAIEITRIPKSNIYTCHGGGYVASGPPGKDKQPQVYLPKGATLFANEGTGEVQTPIHYKGNTELTYGDPIIVRHSKAGELCERFQKLHLIDNGKVVDIYSTYRGDGQCFL